MGFEFFYIGKGIIIPIRRLIRLYPNKNYKTGQIDSFDEFLVRDCEKLIKRKFWGKDLKVVGLGHDAFQGRGNNFSCPAFGNDENGESLKLIKIWSEEEKDEDEVYYESDLIFIGQYEEVTGNYNLNRRAETSELLYSLSSFLPSLIKNYNKILPINLSYLEEEFDQKVCIWTFANDCACCT